MHKTVMMNHQFYHFRTVCFKKHWSKIRCLR